MYSTFAGRKAVSTLMPTHPEQGKALKKQIFLFTNGGMGVLAQCIFYTICAPRALLGEKKKSLISCLYAHPIPLM
jgi:hypothetical protein